MEKQTSEHSRNWLRKLKEESWEAELLISTVAIVGTLQLFDAIDWATDIIIDWLLPSQYLIGYGIVFGGLLAISILTTMFIIHFMLRAYWVGLVGLNSVFPDYGLEESAYSEIYTKKMLGILPKLKDTIQAVDDLCSVIFSSAFFMLMVYMYMSFMASLYLVLYNALSKYVSAYILLLPFFLFIIVFVIQSILMIIANMKVYKQNETIQIWYFNFTKWGSILMLGPLYKLIYQISMSFGSNFKKKKSLAGMTIAFIAIGVMIAILQFEDSKMPHLVNQNYFFDDTRVYYGYYESKTPAKEFLIAPQIESDIIEKDIMQLFIPIYKYERNGRENICGLHEKDATKSKEEQRKERRQWNLDCYNSYNQVYLNDKEIVVDFMKYNLAETGQLGILAYINLEAAKRGKNTLKIIKKLDEETLEWTIPFQYLYHN